MNSWIILIQISEMKRFKDTIHSYERSVVPVISVLPHILRWPVSQKHVSIRTYRDLHIPELKPMWELLYFMRRFIVYLLGLSREAN
jgi:hypothetical protein